MPDGAGAVSADLSEQLGLTQLNRKGAKYAKRFSGFPSCSSRLRGKSHGNCVTPNSIGYSRRPRRRIDSSLIHSYANAPTLLARARKAVGMTLFSQPSLLRSCPGQFSAKPKAAPMFGSLRSSLM